MDCVKNVLNYYFGIISDKFGEISALNRKNLKPLSIEKY